MLFNYIVAGYVIFIMMLTRLKIFPDESIESFLIRLSHQNGYSVRQMIDVYYRKSSKKTAASMPNLNTINLNNASISSTARFDFFKELAVISNNSQNRILNSLIYRSDNVYSQSLKLLLCRSIEIPTNLYRNIAIPICPLCLSEKDYIRQIWHLKPYLLCHKHKVLLINNCPSCGSLISYVRDESISTCSCGNSLSGITPSYNNSNDFLYAVSALINRSFNEDDIKTRQKERLLPTNNIHIFWGMIIFYIRFFDKATEKGIVSDGFIDFITDWPKSYHTKLELLVRKKFKCLIKPANQSSFDSIFGELLCIIQNLPDNTFNNNLVLKETFHFIQKKLEEERDQKNANKLSGLLLTKQEAALLLGTNTEQVAKLTAEGYLTAVKKKLEAYIPIYHLGEVFDLWITHFQNRNSNMFYYLSRI